MSERSKISFDELPDSGFVRAGQLVRSKNSGDALLPLSRVTLWRWVNSGEFPRPYQLGDRTTAWNVGEVRAWLRARKHTSAGAHATRCSP